MKKMIFVALLVATGLTLVNMGTTVALAETGISTNQSVPLCKTRDTAFSATIAVTLTEGKKTVDEINKELESSGCILIGKNLKFKIHSKTKGMVKGFLVHYAQVSLISADNKEVSKEIQADKWWIAGPYKNDGQVNILKLDNGTYW